MQTFDENLAEKIISLKNDASDTIENIWAKIQDKERNPLD